ncbi:hypothetical protein DAPPUDRAFT_238531 [Daphnia pulex]|uniref:Uncharacterized protein n=1 Tax=Daphnia pulex TaxID=6669 RepID=E9G6M5_DAPPU|nr:hypothetical protein DAPPUDRAFT_238531 [Daphnia pulex]|eukprot:EFX84962.1 hypothetical protein DAPPUDRAFT_238531 [Daphnia pulex]
MNPTTHEEEKKIDVPFLFCLSVSESTSDTYKMYSTFDERETNNLPDVSVEPETSFVTSAKRSDALSNQQHPHLFDFVFNV